MIDSHQHFWQYNPQDHAWIDDQMHTLKQDFMPPDLKKEMDRVGLEGCVAVQADQTEAETDFLLDLYDRYEYIKGVVGWLDIRADNFEEKLDQYAEKKGLKGLRHIVQDEPDDQFLLRPDFLRGIKTLGGYDLAYDILIFSRHLPVAVKFAMEFPEQKFVLDHIAKPEIAEQEIEEWERGIRELAQHPNMYCKVSGMVTEADWDYWQPDDFKPYLDIVFDAFGTDRLMFGSDWPVCTLAASYREVWEIIEDYIQEFTDEKKVNIMGINAKQFYSLDTD